MEDCGLFFTQGARRFGRQACKWFGLRGVLTPWHEGRCRSRASDASTRPDIRACLKRSCSRCETPHHQVDHSDSDPRLRGLRQGLKVFTEPPRTIEPAKGTFHDPAPLHDLQALGVPGAFHNHEGSLQDRRHPRDELAGVPPIGPDQFQSRKVGDECPEHLFGPITVLDPRSMHYDDEE
jgi:hypothetical protein